MKYRNNHMASLSYIPLLLQAVSERLKMDTIDFVWDGCIKHGRIWKPNLWTHLNIFTDILPAQPLDRHFNQ